jgi:two-component system response regulator HydG
LRERMEDLELFIDFFIEEANRDLDKNISGVQPALLDKFYDYDWNGNIRELKNVIRRGCLMATNKITIGCMSKDFLHKLSFQKNRNEFEYKYAQNEAAPVEDLKYKSIYAEHVEIMRILQEENFNKTRTAERLNINRKTLYNKLKTFDMLNGLNS